MVFAQGMHDFTLVYSAAQAGDVNMGSMQVPQIAIELEPQN